MAHIHLLLPRFPLLLFQPVSSLHCRPHCWWSGNCQGLCIEMSLVVTVPADTGALDRTDDDDVPTIDMV